MHKPRLTEEQMVAIIRKADRGGGRAVANRHKAGEQTRCTWRNRFAAFEPVELRRPEQPEQHDAPLKKPVAECDPEIEVMKEIAAKTARVRARQEQASRAIRRAVPQRRACTPMNVARPPLECRWLRLTRPRQSSHAWRSCLDDAGVKAVAVFGSFSAAKATR